MTNETKYPDERVILAWRKECWGDLSASLSEMVSCNNLIRKACDWAATQQLRIDQQAEHPAPSDHNPGDELRAAFENWAAAQNWSLSPEQNNVGGVIFERYKHPRVQVAWRAWEAAATRQREKDAQICDAREQMHRDEGHAGSFISEADRCAEAIRAQAETPEMVFRNDGNSDARYAAYEEGLNCPACGGSGHVGDIKEEQPTNDPQDIPLDTGDAEADRLIGRLLRSPGPTFNDCFNAAVLIRRLIAEQGMYWNANYWKAKAAEADTALDYTWNNHGPTYLRELVAVKQDDKAKPAAPKAATEDRVVIDHLKGIGAGPLKAEAMISCPGKISSDALNQLKQDWGVHCAKCSFEFGNKAATVPATPFADSCMNQINAEQAALDAADKEIERLCLQRADMAMMLKRAARFMDQPAGRPMLSRQIMSYLLKLDMVGSPMREDEQ